jgi:hypothetical protein
MSIDIPVTPPVVLNAFRSPVHNPARRKGHLYCTAAKAVVAAQQFVQLYKWV